MKLKAKNLNWSTGKPIVILCQKTARKLNINLNERAYIRYNNKKVFAIVNIFVGLVKQNEIGLSRELFTILKNKEGDSVSIEPATMFEGAKIIKKKMQGIELSFDEIKTIIGEITNNNLTEAEIAYFIAAEKLVGISSRELLALTEAMVKTGKKLDFNSDIVADKHCIGGIAGNRTTPIVVAICAAAGLKIPKSSSRAITSAAGTADVIETISNVEHSLDSIKKIVKSTNGCLVWGGSLGLAPSDDKIIQVERLLNVDVEPQLIASIMSKKIAAGSNRILIDIPFGGGKIRTLKHAKRLGEKFRFVGNHFGVKVKPVYTDGTQPIGNGIGPNLEMIDLISVLKNDPRCPEDLKEKSIYLSAEIFELCGVKSPRSKAREILESGKAYKKFVDIINAQNNSNDFDKRVSKLKPAKYKKEIISEKKGFLKIPNTKLNQLCRRLGTPETASAGIYLHKHNGYIEEGDIIATMYSESNRKLEEAMNFAKKDNVFDISKR